MSDFDSHLIPGLDLSAMFGGYASALDQAIAQAVPNAVRGTVIYHPDPPPTVGQPSGYPAQWYQWHRRCVWIDPTTGIVYAWKADAGWENVAGKIPNGAIVAEMLQDGIVSLAKLSITGGGAGQIIRVNSSLTGFEFVSIANAIPIGSLNLNRLAPGGVNQFVKTNSSNQIVWAPIVFGDLNPGLANQFVKTVGGAPTWVTLQGSDIPAGSMEVDRLISDVDKSLLIGDGIKFVEKKIADLEKLIPAATLIAGANGSVLKSVSGKVEWTIEVAPDIVDIEAMVVFDGEIATTGMSVASVDTGTNTITFYSSHSLAPGDVLWMRGGTESAPQNETISGIVSNTPYYAEVPSGTEVILHTTKAGAIAGSAGDVVNLSSGSPKNFQRWNSEPLKKNKNISSVLRLWPTGERPGRYLIHFTEPLAEADFAFSIGLGPSKATLGTNPPNLVIRRALIGTLLQNSTTTALIYTTQDTGNSQDINVLANGSDCQKVSFIVYA